MPYPVLPWPAQPTAHTRDTECKNICVAVFCNDPVSQQNHGETGSDEDIPGGDDDSLRRNIIPLVG